MPKELGELGPAKAFNADDPDEIEELNEWDDRLAKITRGAPIQQEDLEEWTLQAGARHKRALARAVYESTAFFRAWEEEQLTKKHYGKGLYKFTAGGFRSMPVADDHVKKTGAEETMLLDDPLLVAEARLGPWEKIAAATRPRRKNCKAKCAVSSRRRGKNP